MITIYTDGSVNETLKTISSAWLVYLGDTVLGGGTVCNSGTDSNLAEILAAIHGIEDAARHATSFKIEVVTDSTNTIDIMAGSWDSKAFYEEAFRLKKLVEQHGVTYSKVKAHTDRNVEVDAMARYAAGLPTRAELKSQKQRRYRRRKR